MNGYVSKLVDKWVSGRTVLRMDRRKNKANAGSNKLPKSGRGVSSEEKSRQDVACLVSTNDSGQFVWADGCSSEWLHVPILQCDSVKKISALCYISNSACVGRDSSVGIATRYGLESP